MRRDQVTVLVAIWHELWVKEALMGAREHQRAVLLTDLILLALGGCLRGGFESPPSPYEGWPDGALVVEDATAADAIAAQSDAATSDLSTADALMPDAAAVDTATPDAATPDTVTFDAATPDTVTFDAATPDTVTFDAATPDTAMPDTAMPDAAMVDAVAADSALEDATAEDATTADAGTPIVFDDFEDGDLAGWELGGPGGSWVALPGAGIDGDDVAAAMQTGAGLPSYMELAIDLSGHSSGRFDYARRLVGLDAADDFAAAYFSGGWVPVEQLGSQTADDPDYVFKSFSIPATATAIRFVCECGEVSEACYIDAVAVYGQ